jgi:serine/threonine protein kinase
MAPEVYTRGNCNEKVDVYAFGLILYEIIGCDGLFSSHAVKENLYIDLQLGRRPPLGATFNDLSRKLIERCWSVHPEDRPSFSDMWREIEERKFALIPGVKINDVNSYLTWVKEQR